MAQPPAPAQRSVHAPAKARPAHAVAHPLVAAADLVDPASAAGDPAVPSRSLFVAGDTPSSPPAPYRPTTVVDSPQASSAWSTKASRASRMTGARSAPGR